MKNEYQLKCWFYLPIVIILSFLFFLPGCGGPKVKARKDRVIQTSGGGKPDWALEEPRYIKKKVIYVSGQSSIRGEKALTQGLMAAELDAKARLASEIGVKLNQQLQFAIEGFDLDNQTIRNLTKMTLDNKLVSGAFIKERYYQKVGFTTTDNPEVEQTRYDCYALAAMKEDDLKNQVNRAWAEFDKAHQDKKEITPELRKRFEDSWDTSFQPGQL